jgi:DNA-binding NarL/FixJ family response regulator
MQLASRRDPLAVLLVDDHRVFAEVLAARLRKEPQIASVEVAFSLGAARALVNTVPVDVVLLDYDLGPERGLDLLPDLRARERPPPAVILSGAGDSGAIIGGLEHGVQGWLLKDADVATLLTAVEQVLDGNLYLYPGALRPVVDRLLGNARGTQPVAGFVATLSQRELEVLRCLVAGMTRAEVAQRLFISTNTVRTHVQRLLQRAEVHSTLALVAKARELGVAGTDDE